VIDEMVAAVLDRPDARIFVERVDNRPGECAQGSGHRHGNLIERGRIGL
jgi:hypothetical protein